ncbi:MULTISPECIES: immunity 52 family protein [Paraburkholderia]|nr:immunity 52 family protein [Paraburkholderia podalyriae]
MNLFAQHRDSSVVPSSAFEFHIRRLRLLVDLMSKKDSTLANWYFQGDTIAEALRYKFYDNNESSAAAILVLSDEYTGKNSSATKSIGIWNGVQSGGQGATAYVSFDGGGVISQMIDLEMSEKNSNSSRLGEYKSVAEVIAKTVEIYGSFYVTFGPRKYATEAVFEDRLCVSWMLYLPHALTPALVPEARDLIPVMRDGKRQGTIIVSVTDAVFDASNREHVKAANDIEIRLADQDLLPRFVDL